MELLTILIILAVFVGASAVVCFIAVVMDARRWEKEINKKIEEDKDDEV